MEVGKKDLDSELSLSGQSDENSDSENDEKKDTIKKHDLLCCDFADCQRTFTKNSRLLQHRMVHTDEVRRPTA